MSAEEIPVTPSRSSNHRADMSGRGGYGWAIAAGLNAALAAVCAKLFISQLLKYGLVLLFNATMWGCFVNSLKVLSSLQATVTNFATNFLASGFAGYFIFEEHLTYKWLVGAFVMILGVIVLSKSSVDENEHLD